MAEDAGLKRKLTTLLQVARELHDKQGAILEEMDRLICGGVGIGVQMKAFREHFSACWSQRYTGGYGWSGVKESNLIKRLIMTIGLEELDARVINYIKNDDPFYVKNSHTFGIFAMSVNTHVGARVDREPAPIDCNHSPTCTTDEQHTKRRIADMRSV